MPAPLDFILHLWHRARISFNFSMPVAHTFGLALIRNATWSPLESPFPAARTKVQDLTKLAS